MDFFALCGAVSMSRHNIVGFLVLAQLYGCNWIWDLLQWIHVRWELLPIGDPKISRAYEIIDLHFLLLSHPSFSPLTPSPVSRAAGSYSWWGIQQVWKWPWWVTGSRSGEEGIKTSVKFFSKLGPHGALLAWFCWIRYSVFSFFTYSDVSYAWPNLSVHQATSISSKPCFFSKLSSTILDLIW